jgi:hypothetical protein
MGFVCFFFCFILHLYGQSVSQAGNKLLVGRFSLGSLFNPEGEVGAFVRNVSGPLPKYTASCSIRFYCVYPFFA